MKINKYLLTGIGALALGALTASAATRTWTDAQGRKVEAAFIKLDGDTIYIQTADGSVHPLPLSRFSAEDQEAAKTMAPADNANILAQVPTNATAAQAAGKIDQLVAMGLQKGNVKLAEAWRKQVAEDAKKGVKTPTPTALKPNPPCTDEQFIRRVYLDIVGRIPNYTETSVFIKSASSTKRAELIDKLLASDGYVNHMYDYFADMLRITEGTNQVRTLNYAQWLKQQVVANRPYNEIVFEMLTAEGKVWNNGAAGYLLRDSGMPLDNLANTLTVFLGTDVACAQCHDHPFSDWTQMQFYQMASFFGATTTRLNGKDFAGGDPEKKLTEELTYMMEKQGKDVKEARIQVQNAVRNVFTANRMSIKDRDQNGMKLPADYKYKDASPNDPVAPKLISWSPKDKENPAYKDAEAELGTSSTSKSTSKKTAAKAATSAAATASAAAKNEGLRNTFAKWATHPQNPRFAMTIANRMWQRAFGLGLTQSVKSIDNPDESYNPELLKHLSSEMVRLKFNLKEFMRVVYNTKAYQSEATTEALAMGEPYYFQGPVLRRLSAEQAWDSYMTLVLGDKVDSIKNTEADLYGRSVDLDLEKATPQTLISKVTALQTLGQKQAAKMGGSLAMANKDDAKKKGTGAAMEKMEDEDMMIVKVGNMKLMRASELEQPTQGGHFLREFGQSDRTVIDGASKSGSVPQVLMMMNGDAQKLLTDKESLIHRTLKLAKSPEDKTEIVFLSILSRKPTLREKDLAKKELQAHGEEGYSNMIWALINTREFTFMQ